MINLSQRDPRWANVKMGPTSDSIGNYGCAITCIAMLAGTDPYQVNLKNPYAYADIVDWAKVAAQWGLGYNSNQSKALSYPVIAETRIGLLSGGTTMHFIIVNADGSQIDPWTGGVTRSYKIISYRNLTAPGGGGLTSTQYDDIIKQFQANDRTMAALNVKEDANFQALWGWCNAIQNNTTQWDKDRKADIASILDTLGKMQKILEAMASSEALQGPKIDKAVLDSQEALKNASVISGPTQDANSAGVLYASVRNWLKKTFNLK